MHVQKSCTRAWIIRRAVGKKWRMHVRFKLFFFLNLCSTYVILGSVGNFHIFLL